MSESHLHYPQQPFRVGVIGTGSMGKNHARIFGELKDSYLSAILDERAEVAQEIADKYHAKACANLDEFTESVDAATIATPTVTVPIVRVAMPNAPATPRFHCATRQCRFRRVCCPFALFDGYRR